MSIDIGADCRAGKNCSPGAAELVDAALSRKRQLHNIHFLNLIKFKFVFIVIYIIYLRVYLVVYTYYALKLY